MLKRIIDITVSAAALLVTLPLMAAIALAVWVDSGRPVFFAQYRVGKGFEPFRIWKFRSMRSANSGPAITVAGDRRVTRVGRILRAAKLDEWPQFWNVLAGDMSLVGPRPEVPAYVELYPLEYASVLTMRPGITDLASITYRNEEQLLSESSEPERYYREVVLPEKLVLATEYIQRQSLALDLRILFRTVLITLNGRNAKC